MSPSKNPDQKFETSDFQVNGPAHKFEIAIVYNIVLTFKPMLKEMNCQFNCMHDKNALMQGIGNCIIAQIPISSGFQKTS